MHHNESRSAFSFCGCHEFKKYYIKLLLVLIDMAMMNASMHYFLRNPDKVGVDKQWQRATFSADIADALLDTMTDWRSQYGKISEPGRNEMSVDEAIANNDILEEIGCYLR